MTSMFGSCARLETKKTPITDNYNLTQTVLGVGINGKVIECVEKKTGNKYALKVGNYVYALI